MELSSFHTPFYILEQKHFIYNKTEKKKRNYKKTEKNKEKQKLQKKLKQQIKRTQSKRTGKNIKRKI